MAIVDLTGRLVQKIEKGNTRVTTSNLSAGTYFLTYETEGKRYVDRFIKK
jgi:hypothetical protein